MKRRMKRVAALSLCILLVFAICACGNSTEPDDPTEGTGLDDPTEPTDLTEPLTEKVKMSIKEFESKSEDLGLVVPLFNNAIVAGVKDSAIVCKASGSDVLWQAEYYIITNEESANATFKNLINSDDENTLTKPDGSIIYEKTADGEFLYIVLYGKSIFYVCTDEQYASEAQDYIRSMGF